LHQRGSSVFRVNHVHFYNAIMQDGKSRTTRNLPGKMSNHSAV